jgi:hypothetical protein
MPRSSSFRSRSRSSRSDDQVARNALDQFNNIMSREADQFDSDNSFDLKKLEHMLERKKTGPKSSKSFGKRRSRRTRRRSRR